MNYRQMGRKFASALAPASPPDRILDSMPHADRKQDEQDDQGQPQSGDGDIVLDNRCAGHGQPMAIIPA